MTAERGERQTLKQLQTRAAALQKPLDEGNWEALKKEAQALIGDASEAGIDSAYLWWCLTAAHDSLGETMLAIDAVSRAARLDPVHPAVIRAFSEVCGHARDRLCAEEPTSSLIPELHERLSRIGEADVECHLARARYEFERGDTAGAVKLINAVLVIAPGKAEAWQLRYEVADQTGDPDAGYFEVMADEAELAESHFAVPSTKARC
jgi:tetratricopeptide (TPR) repeat protein